MNKLIENCEKFKKIRAIFYSNYNIKLESAYDKIFGIDLDKLEQIVDDRILDIKEYSEYHNLNKLADMSIKEKCQILFSDYDIERLKDLF